MTMVAKSKKSQRCTVERIDNDYVTITMPNGGGRHLKGQHILVTVPVEKKLALSGKQIISEIVARGKVVSTVDGKITVHSPADDVISVQARNSALSNKQKVTIKKIKCR